MPAPEQIPESQGLLARLVHPAPGRDPAGWAVGAALIALAASGAAWLFTPGSKAQRFPGEEALGQPAVGSFRAPRDFEIVDEEATVRLREEASAAEPPVYDADEGAAEEAVARVRGAFQAGRAALGAAHRSPGRRADPSAAAAVLAARLGDAVGDADAVVLAEARLGEPLEQRLAALVAHGLSQLVIEDRERLAEDAERGVALRAQRGGVFQGERLLLDLALVRDLRAAREEVRREAAALPASWPPSLREAVARVATQLLRPTLSYNQAETARRKRDAADRVKAAVIQVRRGERIVGDGERIERRHLVVFRGIAAQTRARDLWLVRLGGGILVALLLFLLWRHSRRGERGFRALRRDALLLALLYLGTLGLAAAGMAAGTALHDRFPRVSPEAWVHLVPFAAGAMLARLLLSGEIALRFAVASGLGVGLLVGHSIFFALFAVCTAVAASGLAPRSRGRHGLVEAGVAVGVIGAALALGAQLFTGRGLAEALAPAGLAFLGGALLLPSLVVLLLPLVERTLGYVTDVRLRQLANLNHPALKDLIVQAPGTYHHSLVMGSLVEAAAEAAGANPLLARVCAYYHDIGKLKNPGWFSENQRGVNRHDQLAPSVSALIVKRHVEDGLELARRWKLPAAVADAISEHHGTRLVSFFWKKALRAAEAGEGPWTDPAAVGEALFRYPGPRPRSRETALVMMADVVEASARAQAESGDERFESLVAKRLDELIAEGQLDECPVTLRELWAAAAAMTLALEEIYRVRGADEAGRPAAPDEPSRPGLQLVVRR